MGRDAEIYFRSGVEEPVFDESFPLHYECELVGIHEDWEPAEATHEVVNQSRYYGYDYEVGDWPELCSVLMILLRSPDVESVWYYHDCGPIVECTIETVLDLSRYYMNEGKR